MRSAPGQVGISPALSTLTESVRTTDIRRISDAAHQMPDVIRLTMGEPDAATPDWISAEVAAALAREETHYPPNAGIEELRGAVARRYERLYPGKAPSPAQVMIGVGGMESLLLALATTVGPGDEVVLPDPSYTNYLGQLSFVGATAVPVPVDMQQHRLDPADVISAFTPRTRAVLLNSPSNPLGEVMPRADLEAVITAAAQRGIWVISDEVYDVLVYDDQEFTSALTTPIQDNVIVINSLSKTYAMTGWRVGYAVGPERVIAAMPPLQEVLVSGVPPFLQHAAAVALDHGDGFVAQMRAEYQRRRDFLFEALNEIPGIRSHMTAGAFYAFVDISAFGLSSTEFCMRLLHEHALAVIPGTAFGETGKGYVRLSFAASTDDLSRGLERLAAFCTSLSQRGA